MSMKRFRFLGKTEILKKQALLEKDLDLWVSQWTLSRVEGLEICYLRASEDLLQVVVDGRKVSVSELERIEEFNWGKLIFGKYLDQCTKKIGFEEIVENVRNEFLENSLGFKLNYSERDDYYSAIKDQVCILVNFGDLGRLVFYQHFDDLLHGEKGDVARNQQRELCSFFDAIQHLRLDLVVKTKLGEIEFSDLIDLKKGKIVKFSRQIENAFIVTLDNIDVFRANLGKIKDDKGVSIRGFK